MHRGTQASILYHAPWCRHNSNSNSLNSQFGYLQLARNSEKGAHTSIKLSLGKKRWFPFFSNRLEWTQRKHISLEIRKEKAVEISLSPITQWRGRSKFICWQQHESFWRKKQKGTDKDMNERQVHLASETFRYHLVITISSKTVFDFLFPLNCIW